MRLYPIVAVVLALFSAGCSETEGVLRSPDGRIELTVALDEAGAPTYSAQVDGRPFILPSALGIETREARLTEGFTIVGERRDAHDEEWSQPWGENKRHRNRYNELAVEMANAAGRLTLRLRAFDEGFAFRYEWAVPEAGTLAVTAEKSAFRFAEEGTSWSIPAHYDTYELKYRTLPLSEVGDANTPFTFRTASGLFGSIHEAALYDYPEMVLRRDSSGTLAADLAPLPDGIKAYTKGSFTTPWRTVQVGRRAVDLINSSLILNLNEPSRIADTSWIRPQKYCGVWWGMHLGTQTWVPGPRHGATTANALRHIDFAAANRLQGVLFEGWNLGWENWGGNQHFDYVEPYADFDLERIAAYAREKGIELWMHNETGGNIPEYEAQMEEAFRRYAALGVHTLKTGYAGGFAGGYLHHSQYGVQHYQRVVELAARYRIMIDAHEPIKDTGIRRTWPNMMTREGARGMEWNAWSEGNSAEYLCTIPFTRLLGGPMDYTPGIFDLHYRTAKRQGQIPWNGDNSQCCIKTTQARQIANWVLLYSPLQMAADLLENYEGEAESRLFQFFRDFDADCDWSRALQGEVGEYLVVARRSGERFFVGAGTNDEARTLKLPLDFLRPGVTYRATQYADSAEGDLATIVGCEVTAADTIAIRMLPRGGQAISLLPVGGTE